MMKIIMLLTVGPILKQLHWLTVHLRIVHNGLCLVYKAMTFATAPIYIKDMLELYRPARDLRSSSKGLSQGHTDALEIVLSSLPDLPGGTSCHPLFKETRHS